MCARSVCEKPVTFAAGYLLRLSIILRMQKKKKCSSIFDNLDDFRSFLQIAAIFEFALRLTAVDVCNKVTRRFCFVAFHHYFRVGDDFYAWVYFVMLAVWPAATSSNV